MITTRAMNPTDTTLAPTLCCYEGCDAVATTTDNDGDECCAECAAKNSRWVIVTDLSEDARWCDAGMAEQLEETLADLGYEVEIREPRRGEAEGTYLYWDDGQYSMPREERGNALEHLNEVIRRAWNKLI